MPYHSRVQPQEKSSVKVRWDKYNSILLWTLLQACSMGIRSHKQIEYIQEDKKLIHNTRIVDSTTRHLCHFACTSCSVQKWNKTLELEKLNAEDEWNLNLLNDVPCLNIRECRQRNNGCKDIENDYPWNKVAYFKFNQL